METREAPEKLDLQPKQGGKPFQFQYITEHERETAGVILRQVFELKQLARNIAKEYHNDDSNPASIGQAAAITLDALRVMREKLDK